MTDFSASDDEGRWDTDLAAFLKDFGWLGHGGLHVRLTRPALLPRQHCAGRPGGFGGGYGCGRGTGGASLVEMAARQ